METIFTNPFVQSWQVYQALAAELRSVAGDRAATLSLADGLDAAAAQAKAKSLQVGG